MAPEEYFLPFSRESPECIEDWRGCWFAPVFDHNRGPYSKVGHGRVKRVNSGVTRAGGVC